MTVKEKLMAFNIVAIVYAMDEEGYEEYLAEALECWKLPYNIIEEYLPAVILINDKTFDKEKMKEFFDYYLKKQIGYPEVYRIAQEEAKMAKYIIEKEIATQEFWSSISVLIQENEIKKSKHSEFILQKAEEFLEETELKKVTELTNEEFTAKVKEGFRIISFDC